ncbi:MAG: phosphodiesterase [Rhodoferax sp.]|uniref:HD-GYP domain-containing protein n=1 Tax=Rhodoferax sp. TaxID=50421 RepID=UPI0026229CE0|nr:phosphodiesterase [Rhodoferax sp.]MDD2881713.1 phosphodiesterase [Rhodoferax sp.]
MRLIVKSEDEYEDLLGQWSDLESSLGVILAHPTSAQEFEARIYQYDRWMQDLIQRDADVALYLLFQLAAQSPVGYSASHALVCAVLCHLVAPEFELTLHERNSLVRAAFTMNIAMTALQDQLATQRSKPSQEQQTAIKAHTAMGALMLGNLGIANELWLETIQLHHQEASQQAELETLTPPQRLGMILQVVDRYAAMISPRQSREGRSAVESAKNIIHSSADHDNPVGQALVRIVGLCPPGTFVQLDDDKVAVVMRRSDQPNLPDVAIVLNAHGDQVKPPTLHHTAEGRPGIKGALPASAMQERINHHVILQLGMQAA